VTSLRDLGCGMGMHAVDAALQQTFEPIFGHTEPITGSAESQTVAAANNRSVANR
jgi:hypothetical protein